MGDKHGSERTESDEQLSPAEVLKWLLDHRGLGGVSVLATSQKPDGSWAAEGWVGLYAQGRTEEQAKGALLYVAEAALDHDAMGLLRRVIALESKVEELGAEYKDTRLFNRLIADWERFKTAEPGAWKRFMESGGSCLGKDWVLELKEVAKDLVGPVIERSRVNDGEGQ